MPAPDQIKQHFITVKRTARYYVLGDEQAMPREIWIACHGFSQLANRFLRRFAPLEQPGRLIVAPEALNRFYLDTSPRPHGPADAVGATWMTREDRLNEIRDYVAYLDDVVDSVKGNSAAGAPEPSIVALGFSQGVSTAARWATLGRTDVRAIVLCSATVPADLDDSILAQRWREKVVHVIWGNEDARNHADAITRDRERLSALAPQTRWLEFDGGHTIDIPSIRLASEQW